MKFFSLLLFCLISITAMGQGKKITGTIYFEDQPYYGANISLMNTVYGTISNDKGQFELKNIPEGSYQFTISSVGHRKIEKPITIKQTDVDLGELELEKDYLNLDQVVITATRTAIDRDEAPIICNVVNDKILNATQSLTLSEGLSFQPALRIENNCQNCGFNGLRMNGLEGAYTQILIDSRPIYNSLQGVYGLEQFPANMIDRVEIVRSGGSALYGSSAVAGTVNIITKKPEKNQFSFATNQALVAGEALDQVYMLNTDVISQEGKTGISLYGFNRKRDHWDANQDGFSELGEMEATNFGFKSFFKPSEYQTITFQGFNLYEYRRGGNRFQFQPHEADVAETTTHNVINGGLTYEQYSKNYKHKFSVYTTFQDIVRESYYGAGRDLNAYGQSDDLSVVAGAQYAGDMIKFLDMQHTLVAGVEFNHNHLTDQAPAYDRVIDQYADQLGIYVQDNVQIGKKLSLLIGGRFDQHNLLENPVFSPRSNLMYSLNDNLQMRVGYARGFRAPQVFDEDLHITQVGGEGTVVRNANDLTAEFSNAYSASLDFNKYASNWAFGFTIDGFYTRLNDAFILEELGDDGSGNLLLERRNGLGATVAGITLNPKLSFNQLIEVEAGYTFQRSNYDEAVQWSESVENRSNRFFRTPDHYGFYVISLQSSERLQFNFSGVYTGSMIVQHYAGFINEDRLVNSSSFLENNFKVEYTLPFVEKSRLIFNGGVQNFTNAYQNDFDQGQDRDSAFIYGPARPRTYFLGMRIEL